MIVQSADGKFYRNPQIATDKFLLSVDGDDDVVYLQYDGKVRFDSVQRRVRTFGISVTLLDDLGEKAGILKSKFRSLQTYTVKLLKPIPTPTVHQGCFVPVTDDRTDHEGETILKWKS